MPDSEIKIAPRAYCIYCGNEILEMADCYALVHGTILEGLFVVESLTRADMACPLCIMSKDTFFNTKRE